MYFWEFSGGHLQVFREVVLWEVDGYFVFMGDSGGLNKHYLGILGCLWWFLGVVAGIHGLLSNVWGYLGFLCVAEAV